MAELNQSLFTNKALSALREYAAERLQELREANDVPADINRKAFQCGEIQECKYFQSVINPTSLQEEAQPMRIYE